MHKLLYIPCFVKSISQTATGAKYYLSDIGLRYYLLGSKKADVGHFLENIVYLELLRRNYEVHIGKVGQAEVDFIAINEEGEEYYQVAYTVIDTDGATLARELAPLEAVRDHNPKYLLTMDFTHDLPQWHQANQRIGMAAKIASLVFGPITYLKSFV